MFGCGGTLRSLTSDLDQPINHKPNQTQIPQDPPPQKVTHTQQLTRSGQAQVGKQMPFFSGWITTGQVLNLPRLLKMNKDRYVVTMCASWCKPCFAGLHTLSKAKAQFHQRGIELVVYVVDSELKAKKIHQDFEFDWAHVLIDEFKTYARKLSSGKANGHKETLELPRTFILDGDGKIEMIIGQEGDDFLSLLLDEGD